MPFSNGDPEPMIKHALSAAIAAVFLFTLPLNASASGNEAGEAVFKKRCKSCHSTDAGKHKVGPSLAGIVGKQAGTVDGFSKYKGLAGSDIVWDDTSLDGWLANPKKFLGKKTSMSFKLKKAEERAAVIEYLKSH